MISPTRHQEDRSQHSAELLIVRRYAIWRINQSKATEVTARKGHHRAPNREPPFVLEEDWPPPWVPRRHIVTEHKER